MKDFDYSDVTIKFRVACPCTSENVHNSPAFQNHRVEKAIQKMVGGNVAYTVASVQVDQISQEDYEE